jgi:drug/metabolite transporter (DMT)-like permease
MLKEESHISAYFSMLWGAFAFAIMGAISHYLGEYFDWRYVVFVRTLVGFIFSVGLALLTNVQLVFWKPRALWLRSMAGSIGIICTFYALTHLPVADAITLTNTFPIWVTLLSWIVLGQKPNIHVCFAVIVGIIGIILLQQPHFDGNIVASLIALCSALCISIAMLGLSSLKGVDSRAVVTHFSGMSMITTGLLLFASVDGKYTFFIPDQTTIALLLAVGILGLIGQIGMTMAFAKGNAALVSVVGLSEIFFGLGFDIFVWKRTISTFTICGMFLIIAPTAWLLINHIYKNEKSEES